MSRYEILKKRFPRNGLFVDVCELSLLVSTTYFSHTLTGSIRILLEWYSHVNLLSVLHHLFKMNEGIPYVLSKLQRCIFLEFQFWTARNVRPFISSPQFYGLKSHFCQSDEICVHCFGSIQIPCPWQFSNTSTPRM